MNPDRIYSQYRDDALARQATAKEYETFVAMPFGELFSYRSRQIYSEVIQAAATKANELNKTPRKFAVPRRVDDGSGTAVVITESILTEILYSHLFVGDLTFTNTGVLLEVGIAMGLKPNPQIILITQGNLRDLHFDIRNNNVLPYNSENAVPVLTTAMISAAKSFEMDVSRIVESIERTLTPDAILTLNFYGRAQRTDNRWSLHLGVSGTLFTGTSRAEERFEAATRELLATGLIFTDYKVKAVEGGDAFGMHATELGWVFIGRKWPEIARVI